MQPTINADVGYCLMGLIYHLALPTMKVGSNREESTQLFDNNFDLSEEDGG
jgi:hypothetical protein